MDYDLGDVPLVLNGLRSGPVVGAIDTDSDFSDLLPVSIVKVITKYNLKLYGTLVIHIHVSCSI